MAAITAAVRELYTQGIQCELIENATPRAYYANQKGMGKADLVLKLQNSRYDIGFYKQEDGTYELATDFWGQDVEKLLGATKLPENATAETKVQAKLGKLYQLYAANAAEIAAQNQGFQTQRINGTNGEMQIIVTGY